ncbi:hypothetical protein, partial [Pseudomonas viridiflava]|uniref:hypothetical protein n=1 Tax=Pseudomonas viridiflava TaxID=33069 RepID=UPI0013CE7C7B
STAAGWLKVNGDIRALAGRVNEREALIPRAKALDEQAAHLATAFHSIADELALDLAASVGAPRIYEVHLNSLAARLSRWVTEQEELHRWLAYR